MPQIRRATTADHDVLLALWLDSVRASHRFLSESEIQALRPVVRDEVLPALELWLLAHPSHGPVAFMGLDGTSLEALFVAPSYLRRGGGRLLLQHARALKGALTVSVNEQNPDALNFYLANGFEARGRSATDGGGRPYPLIHLAEPGA
jgi:putative acetyltransferase